MFELYSFENIIDWYIYLTAIGPEPYNFKYDPEDYLIHLTISEPISDNGP